MSQERSGFRDEWISQWHRRLGYDFPAADVDFLLVEYDRRVPVALVDYKMRAPYTPPANEANVEAIRWMADEAGLSFWWAFYRPEVAEFWPKPMNKRARGLIKWERWMPEAEFQRFLKHLRNMGNTILRKRQAS